MPASVAASAAPIERFPERHRNTTGDRRGPETCSNMVGHEVLVGLTVEAFLRCTHIAPRLPGQARRRSAIRRRCARRQNRLGVSLSIFHAARG